MKDKQSAVMPNENIAAIPVNLLKQIGSTTYVVSVHFSDTSKETAEDKILRLIAREVQASA